MLSKTDNERITRVGPGTRMGNLMRQYWVPALLSSELPAPDCAPVRVLLLGEKLIAFRDSDGQVGLLDNNCPHRGASLFFARNEECGLRCVYHGWKFSTDGTCVDMPNEPPESNFKDKVRARAYPCRERGGIVWTYMGQRAEPPPLPDLEANMLPDGHWQVSATQRECNWLQALEGDIDTSHFGFLHAGAVDADSQPKGTFSYYVLKDRAPRYAVLETEGGTVYGAYRPAEPGTHYWRIGQFLLPFYTMPPQGVLGLKIGVQAWVPMDDEHTLLFTLSPTDDRMRPEDEVERGKQLPNSSDWLARFRMQANAGNDYEIDRDAQRRHASFSGIQTFLLEDQAITESMGTSVDRDQEHLSSSDTMIIRTRRRLLGAADAWAERGIPPPGTDQPEAYRVRSGGAILPEGVDWAEATRDLQRAFVTHAELDPNVTGSLAR
jgi:phthalate 4,5-dioxygenase